MADALGKNGNTIRNILPKMVQAGEIKMIKFGKYLPIDNIDIIDSSRLKKNPHPLFDEQELPPEGGASTLSMLSMGVKEDEANPLPAEEEEDDLPPDDGGSPWWERGAEPPCFYCGKPAGTGRDQWARPLCVDCWFKLPQGEQMRASMPGDEERSFSARAWAELIAHPPKDTPLVRDQEETCWRCEDVAEFYDPAGNAWCEGCLRAGPEEGWQDLLDALPESLRAEPLAIYAAAAYHDAGRPRLWLDSWHISTGERLEGPEVFARLGAALAGDDESAKGEARDRLEALVIFGGQSLRR